MAAYTKNTFVIDASFVLAFLLDESNVEVESFFEKQALGEVHLIAPSLLKYEIGNCLRTKLLRKQLKKATAQKIYRSFLTIKIEEKTPNFSQVLDFALERKLTFYGASYLYLAKKNRVNLLSLDHSLK